MFRKIIGTIGTKILTSLITLVIVVVNARYLGASKVGTINLIIPAISIISLVNNFIGGPALVYLLPRMDIFKLYVPSCIWAVISSGAVTFILEVAGLIPDAFFIHVMALSFLLSLFSVNLLILLGQEKIRTFNTITLLQMAFQLLTLLAILFLFSYREVMAYILALYASYLFAFAASMALVLPKIKRTSLQGTGKVLKEVFRLGTIMQAGNIVQMINYRASYYFLESFFNRAMVGIYSVGVQISEGIWLVSRSIAMVQYARISNEEDRRYAVRLTLNLAKMTIVLSVVILGILLLLPASFFTFIFGPQFIGVKAVMIALATGILMFSVSIIISPFFSGIGKPHYNTVSSAIGLTATVSFCLLLIPRYGMVGAGLAASASYTVTAIFQFIVFVRIAKVRWNDLKITQNEFKVIIGEIRKNLL